MFASLTRALSPISWTFHPDKNCSLPAYGSESVLAGPLQQPLVLNQCIPASLINVGPGSNQVKVTCKLMNNKFSLMVSPCLGSQAPKPFMHDYLCKWDSAARTHHGAYKRIRCGEAFPETSQVVLVYPTIFAKSKCDPADRSTKSFVPYIDICTPKHKSLLKAGVGEKGPDPNHNPVEYFYKLSVLRSDVDYLAIVRRRFLARDETCSGRVTHEHVGRFPSLNGSCVEDPLFPGRFYRSSPASAPYLSGGQYTPRPTANPTTMPTPSPTALPSALPTVNPTILATSAAGTSMSGFGSSSWAFGSYINLEYSIALKLSFSSAINVVSVRYYKASATTGTTHLTGFVYDDASRALLSSVVFAGETSSGWQSMDFPSPVPVSANAIVHIGIWYHGGCGYSYAGTGFAGGIPQTVGIVKLYGATYSTGATFQFPATGPINGNYLIDFTASG